jgi:hypothetical protein
LLVLGVACDGGSSRNGGGDGIDGRGTTTAAVSGFGSFFVAGTEWTLSPTGSVELDGETGDAGGSFGEEDLELGRYLRVDGLRSGDGTLGPASRVRWDEAIRGAVEQNPTSAGSGRRAFTILDQAVTVVQGQTVFSGTSYSSVGRDAVLVVSGPVDSAGRIRATRVRRVGSLVPNVTAVEFKGIVTGLGGGRFDLGDIEVRYACGSTTDCALSGGAPANGRRVEVEGIYTEQRQGGGPRGRTDVFVKATRIRSFSPVADGLLDVPNLVLEGVIDDYAGLGGFTLNGLAVDASRATLSPASPGSFSDGVYVRVEGPAQGGVLRARLMALREGSSTVTAQIASGGLDQVELGKLVLLAEGVSGQPGAQQLVVEVDADTRLLDHVGGDDDLDLGELMVGDTIAVHGVALGAGTLRATGIDRQAAGPVKLRGPVEAVDRDASDGKVGYRALGVFVELVPGTTAVADGDVDVFLGGLVPGEIVEAGDADDGSPETLDIAEGVERP